MVATLGGEHAELLSQAELFRGLDRVTLAKCRQAAHLEPIALRAGEILLRQGDPPDGLYLVTRGTFAIYAVAPGAADGEVHFSTCGRGESFGEIALLTGEARTATLPAQATASLIVIALAPVASGAGIDPWVVVIVTLTASNTFFLPYQSTIYLALVKGTGGGLFSHAQAGPWRSRMPC